ncbi:helix-turn-helix domain-containing protein [Tunturiibacter lichenicola]|jgi:excisionase family DNA binding protein|uniref:helix-turn-helix domain-containing protein n=1 Tax=Tunturiibacter lichenicola TaxID=2051959 RepID=UPI003D9B2186
MAMPPQFPDRDSLHDGAIGHKKAVSVARGLPEPLLDSDEAASIMKIHPKTLQKLARKGIVRGVHIGKLWRFRASEIEEWIDRQLAS